MRLDESMSFPNLSKLVAPSSVAIVGASDVPGSVGARLTNNVLNHSNISGDVYLVNPRRPEVMERATYGSVSDLPSVPDVAVIVVSAARVPGVVQECADKGVRFAAVLSSGFAEAGSEGAVLEDR